LDGTEVEFARLRCLVSLPLVVFLVVVAPAHDTIAAQTDSQASEATSRAIDDDGNAKARLFVLSDIGNEPDDQESLVRLVLYSNDIDIEGIVAVTSNWKRNLDEKSTADWENVVGAYEQVQPNLAQHDREYPTAARLRSLFALGQAGYGLAATGEGQDVSAGAQALIAAVDKRDTRPLWVSVWGGPNTLAEALWEVRSTR
jgi:hypothetical protein